MIANQIITKATTVDTLFNHEAAKPEHERNIDYILQIAEDIDLFKKIELLNQKRLKKWITENV